ncbi:MAG TPA: hypothetical protein VK633_15640 [Verrucomicrobiae bacterium]|nr:hypothetical protein [Verrucomicrobiae bacterium]
MSLASESVPLAFDAPKPKSCGVLNRDGIFYASLAMRGEEMPMEIALHGVNSEVEAKQAFAALARLRHAACDLPAELR